MTALWSTFLSIVQEGGDYIFSVQQDTLRLGINDSIFFVALCTRIATRVDTPNVIDTSACYDTLLVLNQIPMGSIVISPNPVVDYLQLKAAKGIRITQLALTDLMGRRLRTFSNWQRGESLNLKDLPPGLYLLNIQTEAGSIKVFKVLKE